MEPSEKNFLIALSIWGTLLASGIYALIENKLIIGGILTGLSVLGFVRMRCSHLIKSSLSNSLILWSALLLTWIVMGYFILDNHVHRTKDPEKSISALPAFTTTQEQKITPEQNTKSKLSPYDAEIKSKRIDRALALLTNEFVAEIKSLDFLSSNLQDALRVPYEENNSHRGTNGPSLEVIEIPGKTIDQIDDGAVKKRKEYLDKLQSAGELVAKNFSSLEAIHEENPHFGDLDGLLNQKGKDELLKTIDKIKEDVGAIPPPTPQCREGTEETTLMATDAHNFHTAVKELEDWQSNTASSLSALRKSLTVNE